MNDAPIDSFDPTCEGTLSHDIPDDELEAAANGKSAWLMPSATFDAPCC
jgi:hypothetical protein